MKQRLDVLLVEQGHAASREKAKAMIMSGVVFVNGQREDKAGSTFDEKAADSRFYASLCKSWWLKTGESCRTVRLFLKR